LTNQNSIQEELKCRLTAGHYCYYSVQTLLSSGLLYKSLKIKMYKTIKLPVVIYSSETWSLTLREEFGIRLFEKGMLRHIFGSKRDGNGEWRRLHSEKFHSLYRSPNIVRAIKCRRLSWAYHLVRMEEGRSILKMLIGKPGGNGPLGRPMRR